MTDEFEGCCAEVITSVCELETAMFIDMHVDDGTLYQVQYKVNGWTEPLLLTGSRAFILKHDETVRRIKFILKSNL